MGLLLCVTFEREMDQSLRAYAHTGKEPMAFIDQDECTFHLGNRHCCTCSVLVTSHFCLRSRDFMLSTFLVNFPVVNHLLLSTVPFAPSCCLLARMPQGNGIITATAAIAKERAGRRGSGPASRHPRPVQPDDAPDVSVDRKKMDVEMRMVFVLSHFIFPSSHHRPLFYLWTTC